MYSTTIKNIFVTFLFVFAVKAQAQDHSPIKATSAIEKNETTSEESNEKIDAKDLEEVFMKVKRVENVLAPKKKLRKKKYTIA